MKLRKKMEQGFTLIELLIVVIILGILAAAVIPLFSDQSTKARVATMKSDIAALRSQFSLYKVEHGTPPGTTAVGTAFSTRDAAGAPGVAYNPTQFRTLGTVPATFDVLMDNSAAAAANTNLFDQMTGATNRAGTKVVADGTLLYGPYLQKFPKNPFVAAPDGQKIRMLDAPAFATTGPGGALDAAAITNAGFVYGPYTLEIKATGSVPEMPAEEIEAGNDTLQDL